jgi:Immunoglobulin I-set domain
MLSKTWTKPEFLDLSCDDIVAQSGQLVLIDCQLAGIPYPSTRWFFNNTHCDPTRFKIFNSGHRNLLTIRVAEIDNGATLSCLASNVAGETTWSARLRVNPIGTQLEQEITEKIQPLLTPERSSRDQDIAESTKNSIQQLYSVSSPPIIGRFTIISRQDSTLGESTHEYLDFQGLAYMTLNLRTR